MRLVDCSPATDIDRRCHICGSSVPARYANKIISGLPVPLVDTTANRTSPRRVSWIDHAKLNSRENSFVFDESSKLIEGPRRMCSSLRLPYRCPITDSLEILNGDTAIGVKSLTHNPLADAVVYVSGMSILPSSTFTSQSLGALCSLCLKPLSDIRVPPSEVSQVGSIEDFSVAVNSYVFDSKVDTQKTVRVTSS